MQLLQELLTEAVKNLKVKMNAPSGIFKLSSAKKALEDFLNGVDSRNTLSLKTFIKESDVDTSAVESFSIEGGKIVANMAAGTSPSKELTANLPKLVEAWTAEIDNTMATEYDCSADCAFSFYAGSDALRFDSKTSPRAGIQALNELLYDLESPFPKNIGGYSVEAENGVHVFKLDSTGLLKNFSEYAEIYAFAEMIVTECTPKRMVADQSKVSTTVFDAIRKKIEEFLTSPMMGVPKNKANKSAISQAIMHDEVPKEWNDALQAAEEDAENNLRKFLKNYVDLSDAQVNFVFEHMGA